jgi:hypothetical protein
MREYGRPYVVDRRGDLALLYFTDNPLLWPHFLRRTQHGWVIDMWAEVLNVRNYSGWWYTWALLNTGDDFATAFADRYESFGGPLRVRGGDNRPLPVEAYPEITLQPASDSSKTDAEPPPVGITVDDAATRIGKSAHVLVVIYGTWSLQERARMPLLTKLARECRTRGAEVIALSSDNEPPALRQLPDVLRRNNAPFTAVHLLPWQSGQLTKAMSTVGITVPKAWYSPIVAVRTAESGVAIQIVGAEQLAHQAPQIVAACSKP